MDVILDPPKKALSYRAASRCVLHGIVRCSSERQRIAESTPESYILVSGIGELDELVALSQRKSN